jgi:hypothetical protein
MGTKLVGMALRAVRRTVFFLGGLRHHKSDVSEKRPYLIGMCLLEGSSPPVQGVGSVPPQGKWAAFQSIAIRIRARPLG